MEMSNVMKLRVAAAMAIGAVVLGWWSWPIVAPQWPGLAVTFYWGNVHFFGMLILVGLAFLSGLAGYFVSYPYGRQIGPLAVPAGLGVWALRCGTVTSVLRLRPDLADRQAMYSVFQWEGLFWLLLVAVGYLGVLAGERFVRSTKVEFLPEDRPGLKGQKASHVLLAIVATVVIAKVIVGLVAKDVRMYDSEMGHVTGQPGSLQTAFAVAAAFGLAAFLVKRFLQVGYIVVALSTVILAFFAARFVAKPTVLEYMAGNWPEAFFAGSSISILPIQYVAFGCIGAVVGYWWAISYIYWRKSAS